MTIAPAAADAYAASSLVEGVTLNDHAAGTVTAATPGPAGPGQRHHHPVCRADAPGRPARWRLRDRRHPIDRARCRAGWNGDPHRAVRNGGSRRRTDHRGSHVDGGRARRRVVHRDRQPARPLAGRRHSHRCHTGRRIRARRGDSRPRTGRRAPRRGNGSARKPARSLPTPARQRRSSGRTSPRSRRSSRP